MKQKPPLKIIPISLKTHGEASVFVLMAVLLVAGFLLAGHYGESWDESRRYDYAVHSLAAYTGTTEDLTDEKGAFFSMLALLGSKALQIILPGWKLIEAWHFMTFLSFVLVTMERPVPNSQIVGYAVIRNKPWRRATSERNRS